ncbi:MAG: MerR family transcriptional regulator [Actinomycetaceae bacterium]|nr:MerR family transcriptional regulator [Actinomycetaceae bacterium]MDY5855058.1 MerR family transcriptional regulator [Arcanobacterium sp.]
MAQTSASIPADSGRDAAAEQLSWPQDVSHEPTLKIGEVRAIVSGEFPFLAASKIRHFENEGLISPHRTPSNQRLFSLADVERLRFILIEQRDRYAHLAQIKEMLRQLDSGAATHEHPGRMHAVGGGESAAVRPGTRLTKTELSQLVGVPIHQIESYVEAGLLAPDSRGRFTSQAIDIVRYAAALEEAGMPTRQLRAVHTSAHAHAVALVNMLALERARKTPLAQERVVAATGELSALLTHYYRALLLESIDVELR